MGRLKRLLGLSPTRSRVLTILPFLIALMTMGISFAMVVRYEYAIEVNMHTRPLEWSVFQRTNGLLLLGLGGGSFIVGFLIVLAIKRALRSVSEGLERAASGKFVMPMQPVSEGEIGQLQSHMRHMLDALNRMARESGMGATILVDLDGKVGMINPLAQLLLRVAPDEVIGQPMRRVFRGNDELLDLFQQSLVAEEPMRQQAVKLSLQPGRAVNVRVRTSFFSEGEHQQMAVILSDYDIDQVADIRDKIERAARFLTLGSLSAHLAHEIRNPLTSIAGLVELLKDRNPDEQTKQQYIEHIQTSADRLNHLIEGLMDFASIEKCELTPQPIDAMLREVVAGLRHDARSKGREIRLELSESLGDVPCSRTWLSRAVINLLNNACAATPEGGAVTVSLERAADESTLELKVHNTGSYIEPNRRKVIFEPFETGRSDGTGLGLSIVQEIVRAHGGSITIDSDANEGTEFTVCLPLAQSAQTVGA